MAGMFGAWWRLESYSRGSQKHSTDPFSPDSYTSPLVSLLRPNAERNPFAEMDVTLPPEILIRIFELTAYDQTDNFHKQRV